MLNLDYETMGQISIIIFLIAIFSLFGYMMYDQKKQEEKRKKS